MTRIKFCGLRTLDDINAANQLLPEYVGFVFAPKSKRHITPDVAEKLRASLSTTQTLSPRTKRLEVGS